jgi:hypothetical protein
LAKVPEDFFTGGVEDMRPILMNEHTSVIVSVVGVAAHVGALVTDQHALVELGSQTLG